MTKPTGNPRGRPKGRKLNTRMYVSMDTATHTATVAYAKRKSISASEVVRRALDRLINGKASD